MSERRQVERHLEHCEPCRTAYRQLTAHRFPKLRNYTILEELGRGGFGVVYKAVHQDKERVEALKVLFGKTPVRAAYFENEVHLVARLRHPNIATLYEAHLSTTPLYYTMEYVEGEPLNDYLRLRDVSLEQRIEVIKTVAGAIEYAHGQGVIHRDLKPQNIIIDDQGQPRIVDFGIAKRLGLTGDDGEPGQSPTEQSSTGGEGQGRKRVVGTFGYIAPEQMAGQRVDGRADVYSLGVLLFHVIAGQPARFAPHAQLLAEVLHERQVSRADDLAAIMACCVNPVPDQRYQTCADFAADLDNYLAGRPIQARRNPTVAYRAARIAAYVLRRYPQAVGIPIAVAVAFLLAWTSERAGARWQAPGQAAPRTTLIAVMPSTLEAMRAEQLGADVPGFVPDQKKSWRLLYGRLMEKLSDAEPLVVMWDYHFPDPWPTFDEGFVRGVHALKAPVVVGSAGFDLNGEPALCPEIRSAVQGWGILHGKEPGYLEREIQVPLAVQRGFNAPLPSLALAGFAAARFADSHVDLVPESQQLHVRYRRRHVQPGESRWQQETDTIPLFGDETVEPSHGLLNPDDRAFIGRFPLEDVLDCATRAIPFEDVLTADGDQLRRLVAGRAVVIGEMLPGIDAHRLQSGQTVYGCQVQTAVLNSLLARTFVHRLGRQWIALRVGLWAALAGLVALLVPVRPGWPLHVVAVSGVVLLASGAALTTLLTSESHAWRVDATIAAASLLAIGGPIFVVRLLHQRQLTLTPEPVWPAGGNTGSTTVLAPTPQDSSERDVTE